MKFLIAATFKSNKTQQEVGAWLKAVAPVAARSKAEIAVAPSFPHFHLFSDLGLRTSNFSLASQNVSPFPPGSYTGEVNAAQLADLGVTHCLIGHSERRTYFHETHAEICNKAELLLYSGITPILCLREEDIEPQIFALKNSLLPKLIYCFEPPGNIGGTESAPVAEISRVLTKITQSAGDKSRLMYGGSVNAGNLQALLDLRLDGVLVSSASLSASSFTDLLNEYNARLD